MIKRKLSKEQILSIVELKKTLTWPQVAEKLGVSTALAQWYGKKLRTEGYLIPKQPSVEPLDLSKNKEI